jgi:hypothetical protein
MRGSNLILVAAPVAILKMLMPAFEASTFPMMIKGCVIGLYISLSFIGVMKVFEEFSS